MTENLETDDNKCRAFFLVLDKRTPSFPFFCRLLKSASFFDWKKKMLVLNYGVTFDVRRDLVKSLFLENYSEYEKIHIRHD